jgi:hypothetical protein
LPIDERIVYHWGEEIESLNERNLLGQLVDTGIVMRVGADKQVGIVLPRKVTQYLRDALRRQLASSASAGSVIDQASFLLPKEQHEDRSPSGSGDYTSLHSTGHLHADDLPEML